MTCNHITNGAQCGQPATGEITFSNDEGESMALGFCAKHETAMRKEARSYEKRGLISLVHVHGRISI